MELGTEGQSDTIRFFQISDIHLAPPGECINDVEPVTQVWRVLARIRDLTCTPSFIIISGDLSNDGSAASYTEVKNLLPELAGPETPVLLALGNHDDRATFRQVVLGQQGDADTGPYCHSQTIDGVQVVVLDSTIPGHEAGEIGPAQLAWLDEQLQAPGPLGSLVVLHHCCRLAAPPSTVKRFVLRDADALEAVVARHNVLGVLTGHSHQTNAAPFGRTLLTTAPAVLNQLDYFAGPELTVVDGSGFSIGQIAGGQLTMHPILLATGPDGA
jgi:3',5'-cyclic AMP phosphodiesterase CpdA